MMWSSSYLRHHLAFGHWTLVAHVRVVVIANPGQEACDRCWFLFVFRQRVSANCPAYVTDKCAEMRAKVKSCKKWLRGSLEPIGKQQDLLGLGHQLHPD